MVFQPGVSGNPAGRPPNEPGKKRSDWHVPLHKHKKIELAVTPGPDGKVDELDLLAAIVSHPDLDVRTRMGAAVGLARYRKPPAQRWVGKPLDLPPSETVGQATETIAKLAALSRANEISLEMANDLISQEQAFIEARTGTDIEAQMAELRETMHKLTAASRTLDVTVIGGLPDLPGTDIIPLANGDASPPPPVTEGGPTSEGGDR
jgi:hypothetical protein